MNERSPKEQSLLERAASYLPGATLGNMSFDGDHAFLVKGGKGSKLWDVSDNQYIDYLLGSGPMVLGHAHPSVVEAVKVVVERGSTFFATNELAVLLAEQIVQAMPCAQKVRFTTSGTDACFQCLRIARAFRKRDKVLKFEGGFHGTSDYLSMSVTPTVLQEFPQPFPNTAGIPQPIQETVLVAPFNDTDTSTAIIEKHHDELAAVILEPLQRILPPKPGFLRALREVTAHYQIPLIFDEVVTCFRLAYGGAQQYYGVIPDLAALGKIVGGGFPLAAVCGREELMAAYDPSIADKESQVSQIGTLNGNPVACAAGLATLKELRKDAPYDRLHVTGRKLREALEHICREAEIPAQTSGENPIFDVYFTDQPITDYRSTLKANTEMMARFNALLLEEGILKGWPQKFYISLAHTEEDVENTIHAFGSVIKKLRS